jgi:L-asparagine oxygenase
MKLFLTPQETSRLADLASHVSVSASPSLDPELFIAQINSVKDKLPQRIMDVLNFFVLQGSPTGFLVISGLPVVDDDILPKTPVGNNKHIGETTMLARIQALFNQVMGDMISYEAEGFGKLFQDMVPNITLSKTQTSLGSDVELEIHTEQAFSKLRPDVLSLACLRGDSGAKTYVLHVKQILDNLSPEKQRKLREPLWRIGVDASFQAGGHVFLDGILRGPIPILSGPDNDPTLVFDQDLMAGVTDEAEQIRKDIVDIYHRRRYAHTLSPGEVVLVDNHRAVHGRSCFHPNFDGLDRFIIRSFVSAKKCLPGQRTVLAKYS